MENEKAISFEYLPVGKLKPYDKNARKHSKDDVDAIIASIRAFGFKDPIGVWGKQNIVVEGHGRLLAAKKLGMDKVPCIRLDDLTDEQRRAYTLAHNRTAELSVWDDKLLAEELEDISQIDMSDFGFDLDIDIPDEGYFGDERERTYNAYNLNDYNAARVTGKYDLPTINKCGVVPKELRGFNYVLNTTPSDAGVHFFLDDYQFERIWNDPYKYMDKVRPYSCMLTPDFSLYSDMPMAMKIWNVYRSRLIGQLYQDAGISVIPTLQWAGEDTLDWCFDGLPKGGTVAVSTVGVMRDKEAEKLWKTGMGAALEAVKPKTVVCYGTSIDFDFGDADVVYIRSRTFHNGEDVV